MRGVIARVLAVLFLMPTGVHAELSLRARMDADANVPGIFEYVLNGRTLPASNRDGRMGKRTRFEGSVDDFLVSGENVLEIRGTEAFVTNEVAETVSQGKRFAPWKFSFKLTITGAETNGVCRTVQVESRLVDAFPARFTFSVTNAWPVRRHPWQLAAPAPGEQDREQIRRLLRGISRCYGNLTPAASKETLYNLKRLEYEHRALLDGVSFADKRREVFAVWGRMAPFCLPNEADFSNYEVTFIPGANLATAVPPGGRYRSATYPDGRFVGDYAAYIATQKSESSVPLPKFFSKLNGQWQVVSGSLDAEAAFVEHESKYGPLEKQTFQPPTLPPGHEPRALPADDEGPEWIRPDAPGGGNVQWRVLRNPKTNRVSVARYVPKPKTWFTNDDPPDTAPGAPGYGAPGRIEPYAVDSRLAPRLKQYGLTAGWFVRDPLPEGSQGAFFTRDGRCTNSIPFLLFTPKLRGAQKMPILMFIPGNGELGTDLNLQFRQRTIFDVVTAPAFQQKYPCYLFVPMPPKVGTLRGPTSNRLSNEGNLINDALLKILSESRTPAIDPERVYLTGLSFGATAVYNFASIIPERFAACVPISSVGTVTHLHPTRVTQFWHFHNERDVNSPIIQEMLRDLKEAVEMRGGEFRISTFPDAGHDAWSKAWREDAVWDWVFSKTADGKPVAQSTGPAKPVVPPKLPGLFLDGAICTAAQPGRDDGTGPERAADGLEATCYVSVEPVARGDWWQIEFVEPVSGRITVKSGTRDGKNRVSSARVETSSDGQTWASAGRFQRASGECRFVPRVPIQCLRVVSESPTGEILVLREVVVAR